MSWYIIQRLHFARIVSHASIDPCQGQYQRASRAHIRTRGRPPYLSDGLPSCVWCEVMVLEIDEPKLGTFAGTLNACDFPSAAPHQAAPAGPRQAQGQARGSTAGTPSTADGGGRRVPLQAPDRPGGAGRHPRPAFLRRVRVHPLRRVAGTALPCRAVGPPTRWQTAADSSCSCGTWRNTRKVR